MRSRFNKVILVCLFIGFAAIFTCSIPGQAEAAGGYDAFLQDVTTACTPSGMAINMCWTIAIRTLSYTYTPQTLSSYNTSCKSACANANGSNCATFCNNLFY